MAYLDEVDVDSVPLDTASDKRRYVHDVVWFMFNAFKDRSITLKKWGISLSFKVAQLRPFVETLVGQE